MTATLDSTPVPLTAADDVINQLAGIAPDSRLGLLRTQRPEIVRYAEGSYRALLEPADVGNVSTVERDLIALRVAVLTGSAPLAAWHQARLREAGVKDDVLLAVAENLTSEQLSPREQMILRHVDRLTKTPATATAAHLAELTAVGLTPRDIVVISQWIAFLSFQMRTLVGLRILGEDK
ncbi:MAG: CMD domain protein [Caldilineaceae bacterium]